MREPLYTADENVNLCNQLRKTVWNGLKKIKLELSNDPVFYRKNKNTNLIDLCAPMYNAALFTIAEVGKQPECPSAYEWVKMTWLTDTHTPPHLKHTQRHTYIQTHIHIHAMEYYSTTK